MAAKSWIAALGLGMVAAVVPAGGVLGWGATGHKMLSGIAIEALAAAPDGVPAFLRTPEAARAIAELSVEPDRSRGSGKTHDDDRDPGHYIGLDDDGTAAGVTPFSNQARTREDYDTQLRARGLTQYKVGYLPYTIVDGWQQLVKDFAYWRALTAVIEAPETTPAIKAWAMADRTAREQLTVRDLGVWSHYVGDASQPLHVSRHSDGWGPYPNPRAFTQMAGTHLRIEGPFVRHNVLRERVASAVRPYVGCSCSFELRVSNYLSASRQFVERMYELDAAGSFVVAKPGEPGGGDPLPPTPATLAGAAFVTERLAAGASELRDMVEDAWKASLDSRVGYPEVAVRAIIKTPSLLTPATFAVD